MADFKGTIGTVPEELRGSLSSDLSLSGRLSSLGIPGNGIASIEKTSTDGLTDTYTITYDDGATTTYQITNGNGIVSAVFNDDNTLTLSFGDGTELTTGVLRGDDGEKVLLKAEDNVVSYKYESDPNWTTLVDLTGFADDASNAADRATAKAEEARQSAIRAENSASDANASAGIATTKAEEAASSEEQAGISMRRAETAASDALASKNLAQEAAATAITAQDNARIYSERTLGYANNAAQSAQSASNSATSAAQSATGLSGAVASAQQSAREAASSATQAQEYYDGIDEVAVQAMEDYLDAHPAVQSVNGKTRNVVLNAEDVGALPEDTFIPSKISDLTDDSGHYTKPATGIPASDLADGVVPDVQINGTSIVEDGVANIPVANNTTYGVAKGLNNYGVWVSNGFWQIYKAANADISAGVSNYKPIVPSNQDRSTFYGLAKAAGHDEKNSTLPVGEYTEDAKTAIKTMLGVSEPSTLIDDTATTGDMVHTWSADKIETELANAGTVQDVQVNGTSIVENGVANVPQVTAWNGVGVVKIVQYRGLEFEASTGALTTAPANGNHIKSGVTGYAPIIPLTQHMSTFYGLAKAAGHDEKDSTLAMGTYTPEAKSAIQNMLGVTEAITNALADIVGIEYRVCGEGEYDAQTFIPTIEGKAGVIYLVPKPVSLIGDATVGTAEVSGNNIYYEFIYNGDSFEMIGDTSASLDGYLNEDDVSEDSEVQTMLTQIFGGE